MELGKAILAALPKDTRPLAERDLTAEDVRMRDELHIESMDCEFFPDVAVWYAEVGKALKEAAGISVAEVAADIGRQMPKADAAEGEPAPMGWRGRCRLQTKQSTRNWSNADVAARGRHLPMRWKKTSAAKPVDGETVEAGPSGRRLDRAAHRLSLSQQRYQQPRQFRPQQRGGAVRAATIIKNLREGMRDAAQ